MNISTSQNAVMVRNFQQNVYNKHKCRYFRPYSSNFNHCTRPTTQVYKQGSIKRCNVRANTIIFMKYFSFILFLQLYTLINSQGTYIIYSLLLLLLLPTIANLLQHYNDGVKSALNIEFKVKFYICQRKSWEVRTIFIINRRRHSNGDIADGSQPFSMEEAI